MRLSTLALGRLSFHFHKVEDAHALVGQGTAKLVEQPSAALNDGILADCAGKVIELEPQELDVTDRRPTLRRETRSHKPSRSSSSEPRTSSKDKEGRPSRRHVSRRRSSSRRRRAPPERNGSSLSRSSHGSIAARGTSRLAVVRRTSSRTLAKLHHASNGSAHATGSASGRRPVPSRTLSSRSMASTSSGLSSTPSFADEKSIVELDLCPDPPAGDESGSGSAQLNSSSRSDVRLRPSSGRRPTRAAGSSSLKGNVEDFKGQEVEVNATTTTTATKTTKTKNLNTQPDRLRPTRRSSYTSRRDPPGDFPHDPRKKLSRSSSARMSRSRSLVMREATVEAHGPVRRLSTSSWSSSSSSSSSSLATLRVRGSSRAPGPALLSTSVHQSARNILAGLDDLDSTLHAEKLA